MWEMRYFTIIFFIALCGFAEAFFYTSNQSPGHNQFIFSLFDAFRYSLLTSLGVFEYSKFDDTENPNKHLIWVIVFFCQLVCMIVLINLLIAIIGDKYNTMAQEKDASCFKERAAGIFHLQFLIPALPWFMTRIEAETDENACKKIILIAEEVQEDPNEQK